MGNVNRKNAVLFLRALAETYKRCLEDKRAAGTTDIFNIAKAFERKSSAVVAAFRKYYPDLVIDVKKSIAQRREEVVVELLRVGALTAEKLQEYVKSGLKPHAVLEWAREAGVDMSAVSRSAPILSGHGKNPQIRGDIIKLLQAKFGDRDTINTSELRDFARSQKLRQAAVRKAWQSMGRTLVVAPEDAGSSILTIRLQGIAARLDEFERRLESLENYATKNA